MTTAAQDPTSVVDDRRTRIHDAAIREFSARGFAATSMARIAEAAGMSRPALYQYFKNKDDIFASAFVALLEGCAERALAALHGEGSTTERLDGLLQRFEGDLWERLAASSHAAELLDRKYESDLHLAVEASMQTFAAGIVAGVADLAGRPPTDARVRSWVELLRLAPRGYKTEAPSVDAYREQLRELAGVVAASIDAG